MAVRICRNRGFCCKLWNGTYEVWVAENSGGDTEEVRNEDGLRPHVPAADAVDLTLPDHRHRLVAGQCPPGSSDAGEAEPGPDQPFDPAVIRKRSVGATLSGAGILG